MTPVPAGKKHGSMGVAPIQAGQRHGSTVIQELSFELAVLGAP